MYLATANNSLSILGSRLLIVFITLTFTLFTKAHADELPYVAQMPNVKQVLSDVKGENDQDTAAKQIAVLEHLQKILLYPAKARPRNTYPSSAEARLINTYHDAESNLYIKVLDLKDDSGNFKSVTPDMKKAREEFNVLVEQHRNNAKLRKETNQKYLPGVDGIDNPHAKKELLLGLAGLLLPTSGNGSMQLPTFAYKFLDNFPPQVVNAFIAQYGEGRLIAVLAFIFLGLPLITLLLIMRELKPFGIDANDPLKLKAGLSHYTINTFTGEVLSTQTVSKSETTSTTYYREGQSPNTQYSTSYWTEDTFFLLNRDGKESSFFTYNNKLAMRPSNIVSVAWGIKKGKKFGHYFLFKNHTTDNALWKDEHIFDYLRPSRWLILIAGFFAAIIEFWYFLPALIVGWIIYRLIGGARVKRFKKDNSQLLMNSLNSAVDDYKLKQAGISEK